VSSSKQSEKTASALTSVAWTPTADLDYPRWVKEGKRLGSIARASPWWVGDWLLYADGRWGEKYREAERITGYDRKTLRNIRYVASRFDLSLRRDDLTWSHHALVASLEPEERAHWLARAVDDRLTVEDLRLELRVERRRAEAEAEPEEVEVEEADVASLTCPHCGRPIELPEAALAGAVRVPA
jgi:hypothetical protein